MEYCENSQNNKTPRDGNQYRSDAVTILPKIALNDNVVTVFKRRDCCKLTMAFKRKYRSIKTCLDALKITNLEKHHPKQHYSAPCIGYVFET